MAKAEGACISPLVNLYQEIYLSNLRQLFTPRSSELGDQQYGSAHTRYPTRHEPPNKTGADHDDRALRHRIFRRSRYQNMHVVGHQMSFFDLAFLALGKLAEYSAQVVVLRREHDVVLALPKWSVTLGCYFEKKSGRSGPDGPHFVELGAYGLGWSHLTYMGGARNLA